MLLAFSQMGAQLKGLYDAPAQLARQAAEHEEQRAAQARVHERQRNDLCAALGATLGPPVDAEAAMEDPSAGAAGSSPLLAGASLAQALLAAGSAAFVLGARWGSR